MSPLDRLGRFVADLSWDAIPDDTQTRARLTLRDTIGCILGGSVTPAGRIATSTSDSDSSALRAFALAVHASALDFDDGHYCGGAIHPASVIVPSLIAAVRALDPTTKVSAQTFLTAQIAGYEIGLRAAHLLWPKHTLDAYHCTGTAATLGAAAAVAKLQGANAEVIARSIAIAWAHAPMSTFQLPMVKESIGWSAATAVFAADLARAGFMAMPSRTTSVMEATFIPTPFHRPGAMDDAFVASLGHVYEAANTYFKPYAACRYTHTALRSMEELCSEHQLTAESIERIDVYTPKPSVNLSDQRPASLEHGQYSFPFVLAALICTGRAGAREISHDALTDPQRLALATKVTVNHDAALDQHYPEYYPSRVVVTTTDGATYDRIRLVAPGDDADPMSAYDLAEKFVRLAEPVHGTAKATNLADKLIDLTGPDCRQLLDQALGDTLAK